jgi:hypothetical protein
MLEVWWEPMLQNPTPLYQSGYQSYAVLTMCRILYTFEHGSIVTKPVAAHWAIKTLGAPWADLIDRTVVALRSATPLNSLNGTLDFIRYTVKRSHQPPVAQMPEGEA